MFSILVRYGFFYCLLSSLKKHWHIQVFVWVVKKRLTALRVLLTKQFLYLSTVLEIALSLAVNFQSDALRDLVPFAQFKKLEKYPWRNITFSKVSLQLY